MNCPKCGAAVPEDAHFCPECGAALAGQAAPQTHIDVQQEVGRVDGGKVTAVEAGEVHGDLTVEATVNQVEAKVIQGDYVNRQTIIQNVLVLGPDAMDQIVRKLAALQGVDKRRGAAAGRPGAAGQRQPPDHRGRSGASGKPLRKGWRLSAQSAYHLGLMGRLQPGLHGRARVPAPGHPGGS